VPLYIHLEKIDKLQLPGLDKVIERDYIHFKLRIGAILKEGIFPGMQRCGPIRRLTEVQERFPRPLSDRCRNNRRIVKLRPLRYLLAACRGGLEEKERGCRLGGRDLCRPFSNIGSYVKNYRLRPVDQR
jgi:hypothetical protein